MDYASIHGNDISNFSSSESPHRMPTVSAAKALEELESPANTLIPTGLTDLDRILQNQHGREDAEGGVLKGHVTEIYGPPGVGKTALGIQVATCVLNKGQKVIWIDAGHPLPYQRLKDIVDSQSAPSKDASSSQKAPTEDEKLSNLTRITTPSLAHFIALLCRPNPMLSLPDTTLIVIDSFSTLISNAFPRLDTSLQATPQKPRPGVGPQVPIRPPASRKFPILQHIISSLNTLATVHKIAIVITSGVVTKMRPGLGALLVPTVSGTAWDEGVGTRICLFRDWGMAKIKVNKDDIKEKDTEFGLRFAGVLKARGVPVGREGGLGRIIPFIITKGGLQEAPAVTPPADVPYLATPTRKRKADEIQDSEDDEDYGWAEEDESEVPVPPQWQGSEDILVPGPEDEEEDEEDEDEDEDEDEEEEEEERTAVTGEKQGTDNKENGKEMPVVADSEEEEDDELAGMDKYTRSDRHLEDHNNGAPLHQNVLDELDAIQCEEANSILEAEFTI